MGIKQITKMRDFGKFKDTESIKFESNTVLFGFNGTGKSTISSIFYSLGNENKDSLITNRRRLKEQEADSESEIYIEIETDSDTHHFSNGKWDKRLNNLTFNGDYIQDNILISNVTKRAGTNSVKLGVELGAELTRLEVKKQGLEKTIENNLLINVNGVFSKYNTDIKQIAATGNTKNLKRGSNSISKIAQIVLYPLGKKKEIEDNLKNTNKYEVLLKEIAEITDKINGIPLSPVFKVHVIELRGMLQKRPSVTTDEIINHMRKYLRNQNVSWLVTGINLAKDTKSCPFCGQSLVEKDSVKFIKTLQDFASRKRNERVKEIREQALSYLRLLDIKVICESVVEYATAIEELRVKKLINNKGYEYYKKVDTSISQPTLESIYNKVNCKIDQPFETIDLSNEEILCLNKVNTLIERLSKLKLYIKECVDKLNQRKLTDKESQKINVLAELSFGQKRLEIEEMIDTANKLIKLESEITAIEKKQIDMRERTHLDDISTHLKELNTKFSLIKEDGHFYLKIRNFNEKVEYTSENERSKYILSEGDQRALAFAYFLFELEQHENESNKIIVFDDPISSLDLSRKSIIAYKIAEEMKKGTNQVIVLSHDISFIEKLENFCNKAKYYVLTNTSNVVEDLNIRDYVLSDEKIYNKFIRDAVNNNTYEDTVIAMMALRPLFETALRGISEMAPTYLKYSTYFNHSAYAKLDGKIFCDSKYKTELMRKYFKYIKRKVSFEYKAEDVIPDNFSFCGFDYEQAVLLYRSISLDNIMNSRKKALMLRVLLEVLMVELSGDFNLKCKEIGKYYGKVLKRFRKGTDEYYHALKIVEAYNQTKKFHHGTDVGSMLGISWINPDEVEYYDSVINSVIDYLESKKTMSPVINA
jgi:wobble nucleotide-excising tRNase